MAKFVGSDVLDNGLNYIKNNASKMLLLKAYAFNDDYATVIGNSICEVDMTAGDYALADAASNARKITVESKNGTASGNSGATPDLHIAFTDGVSKVLVVTDETTDQVVVAPNLITFPSLVYTSGQPAA
jgi:hypothetical protein